MTSDRGVVEAVSSSPTHSMAKSNRRRIRLLAGLGVESDAHQGTTVKHRSRVARDPNQPNLRKVHLIHAELHDELRKAGFRIAAGQMGENITTRGYRHPGPAARHKADARRCRGSGDHRPAQNLSTCSVWLRVSPDSCRQQRVTQRRGDRDWRDSGWWGSWRPRWSSPALCPQGTRQLLDGAGLERDDDERGDGGLCLLSVSCASRGRIRCYRCDFASWEGRQ